MQQILERREFIKLMALAASGLSLSGCAMRNLVPLGTEEWRDYTEAWTPSTCTQCDAGCGIMARVVGGRVVKIEGNPLHPVNHGRLCAPGQASTQLLYNPDRIKAPMKRVGGKGSDKWVKVSWDEAMKEVADRLGEMREHGEAHTLAVFDGQQRGLVRTLFERFCEAYGTPNHISTNPFDGTNVAHYLAQGINEPFGYDIERSNYILSFGAGLLDGWRSPVGASRAYGYLRQERPGDKAKLVQIERRLSTTAARADEWIPINPGTEGALALAMAYVIIREELYDQEFIDNYTFGFHDWLDERNQTHQGFRTLVLKEYSPEDVSDVTGVPVGTIIRVAKEFAQHRPGVAIADQNATHHANGTYAAFAIHALNALAGSIEVPGGVLLEEPVPFAALPAFERDEIAAAGLRQPRVDRREQAEFVLAGGALEDVPQNILSGKPYALGAAFFYNSNPVFTTRLGDEFRRALAKVPLVVSFSSFMDETAECADLILPDHVYLEKWQESVAPTISGIPLFSITQPVVEPLYNTMHTGDFLLKLATALGGTVGEAFAWGEYVEVLKASAEGVHAAGRGAVFAEPFEEAYAQEMQQRGWATDEYADFDAFWDEAVKKGGWWGLYQSYGRWGRAFKTPSRKFEFYSQGLKAKLEEAAGRRGVSTDDLLNKLGFEARGDEAFLPHFERLRAEGDGSEHPFFLNPFRPLALNTAAGADIPWLQEVVGPHVSVQWDSWVEINPETALALGVRGGDTIWVESARGKFRTQARLYAGAMPNVVNVPIGLGHSAFGEWAKGRGINPNAILETGHDPLSGLPAWFSTRVKVYKA